MTLHYQCIFSIIMPAQYIPFLTKNCFCFNSKYFQANLDLSMTRVLLSDFELLDTIMYTTLTQRGVGYIRYIISF